MGFEASLGTTIQEVKRYGSSLKPLQFMGVSSRHNSSKSFSFPDKRVEEDNLDISSEAANHLKLDMEQVKGHIEPKKLSPNTELQSTLKNEILQLEKRLQDQFVVRKDLEKALGYKSSSHAISNEISTPKPANELIKEIAVLELEVVYLEQYLLSLYRRAFDRKMSSVFPSIMNEAVTSPPIIEKGMIPEDTGRHVTVKREHSVVQFSQSVPQDSFVSPLKEIDTTNVKDKLLDSGIHRCHSALSQRSNFSNRTPTMESLARAVRSCHSQPLSYMEQGDTPHVTSLAEHLGTRIADHVPETPNKISEDMIKCMSAIYCKLSDPPLTNRGVSSSPTSTSSSVSGFSPQDQYDIWSPQYRKDSSFDAQLDNPFHMEGLKEFSGPYNTMVEVPWICRDSQMLNTIGLMLQSFRLLVCRLEDVDLRKMKHEEKLAFWINIHNALVMHTFLAYGIPQNNLKRVSLFLKAAYNVGGNTISVDAIQSSILGCRMPRPGQWLRMLFSPRTKFKASDDRQAYSIEHPEPLLHFALCSGSHSDPAVRIYTPKRVIQDLETAKEEYIRANIGLRKEQKILLPKIVESFARDSGLSPIGVVEMIQQFTPTTLWKTTQGSHSRKGIEWVPHNFAFRYLLSKELVK